MNRYRNTIISITLMFAFLGLLLLSGSANGQLNPTGASDPDENNTTENIAGYWVMTSSKSEIFNMAKTTQWSEGQCITGISVWKDILQIEHTISSSFKWDTPPTKMIPGKEIRLNANYINNEYSTPNKVLTGVKISICKAGVAHYIVKDAIDVLKIMKDNKQNASEVKLGIFSSPKLASDRSIQLLVDCYIGNDHFVTTYIYTWMEDGISSKDQ